MPAGNNGFWGGIRNGFFEGVDRLFLNNRGFNYSTGTWDGKGAATGGIQSGLNNALPGLGYLFGKGADYYNANYNYGQAQPADYANNAPADSSGLAGLYTGAGSLSYGGFGGNATNYSDYSPQTGGNAQIGGIDREQFPMDTSTYQSGQNYAPMPNYIPTMPQVTAQGQDGGAIGGFANGIFNGGAGNFGQNNSAPTAAQLAFGGRSQGGIGGATQGSQWTGISGDAARGYFGGMSTGATDALQHQEMLAMAKQRQ